MPWEVRLINSSPDVVQWQVDEIMRGHLSDPCESTMGSRIEAVARLDERYGPKARLRAGDLAELLGVTKRTIERYRRKIRTYTLG